MRIATLQIASRLGEGEANMQRADQLIEEANPVHLDLLVLPEMVFSGKHMFLLDNHIPSIERSSRSLKLAQAITSPL